MQVLTEDQNALFVYWVMVAKTVSAKVDMPDLIVAFNQDVRSMTDDECIIQLDKELEDDLR